MDYCSFFRKKMKKTMFRDCSIKDADFTETDLSMASFTNCDLMNTVFTGTILEKTDFRTAKNYAFDPELNKIRKAKFSLAGIPGLLLKYNIDID
jgi:fluoroquinolone resistance protein